MDGFKQRIIGALVLISLAVIFVPMLLDEPHEGRTTRSIDIPEEPPFPEVRIDAAQEPEPVSTIEQVPQPERPPMQITTAPDPEVGPVEMTADATVQQAGRDMPSTREIPDESGSEPETVPATAEVAVPEQPEISPPQPQAERPVPVSPEDAGGGYLVQLGSFGSEGNAKRLMGSVKEAGFGAHTTSISSDGQSFTRVFAGPFPDKAAADMAKIKLDKQFGLKTLVIVNNE